MSLTILQRTSTLSTTSTFTAVPWSSAITDPAAAWSAGSPTIVTTPSTATKVDALIHLAWASGTSNTDRMSRLLINGTVVEQHSYKALDRAPGHHMTRRYSVSPGDTLSVEVAQSDSTLDFYDAADGMTPYVQFRWWT